MFLNQPLVHRALDLKVKGPHAGQQHPGERRDYRKGYFGGLVVEEIGVSGKEQRQAPDQRHCVKGAFQKWIFGVHEDDLHSPRREAATKLIRIEGKNMDKVRRLAYQANMMVW